MIESPAPSNSDDTVALQAWLDDADTNKILRAGKYFINAPLTLTKDATTISAMGAEIVYTGTGMGSGMLNVNSSNVEVNNIRLDGDNATGFGIVVKGGAPTVKNCTIVNLSSTKTTARAIEVYSNTGAVVKNNTVRNVYSATNNVIGDSAGSSRAIVVASPSGVASAGPVIVSGNVIENIVGEEGDAIHIAFSPNPGKYSMCLVSGNNVSNVSRRMVKLQCSGAIVENNVYRHYGDKPSTPSALIDVQYSNDCIITGNYLEAANFLGIQITGTAAMPATGNVVKSNHIVGGDSLLISVVSANSTSVVGNTVNGGMVCVNVSKCNAIVISTNIFSGGNAAWHSAIKISDDCVGVVVTNNVAQGGPRSHFIHNSSPNAVVYGNTVNVDKCPSVSSNPTAIGSFYSHNNSLLGAATYGNYVGQYTISGISSGGEFSSLIWRGTGEPGVSGRVGDIVFTSNPNPQGIVGKICISPGTWREFGLINS